MLLATFDHCQHNYIIIGQNFLTNLRRFHYAVDPVGPLMYVKVSCYTSFYFVILCSTDGSVEWVINELQRAA